MYLYLQDASGVLLKLEPDPEASVHGAEKEMETGEEESDEEVETLKQALNEVKKNNLGDDAQLMAPTSERSSWSWSSIFR